MLANGQAKYDDGAVKIEETRAKLAAERVKGENELKKAYQKIIDGKTSYE